MFNSILGEFSVHIEQSWQQWESSYLLNCWIRSLFTLTKSNFWWNRLHLWISIKQCCIRKEWNATGISFCSRLCNAGLKHSRSRRHNTETCIKTSTYRNKIKKLLRLILTILATFDSSQRSLALLNRVNNYMRCSKEIE